MLFVTVKFSLNRSSLIPFERLIRDNPVMAQALLKAWVFSRSILFLTESLPLILLQRWSESGKLPSPPKDFQATVVNEVKSLLDRDIEHIVKGVYPAEVLLPEEGPIEHFGSLGRVLGDALKLKSRKEQKDHKQFSEEAEDWARDLPEYYTRNFHFQTDGYLSESSAELYDHQVELLFRGVSHAMRRLLLPPLKAWSPRRPLKILEVGCGTGSFTRFLAMAFPEAKITAFDLSFPYLKKAQSRLKKFSRIEYVQGQAEELPFRSEQFDAVVSVFLFHELPLEIRKASLLEMTRVLKPEGFLGLVDSLQINDKESLNWGLEQFPKDFHEPFYKNYLNHPMKDLLEDLYLTQIGSSQGFLSKALWGTKPGLQQEI